MVFNEGSVPQYIYMSNVESTPQSFCGEYLHMDNLESKIIPIIVRPIDKLFKFLL